jgi:hypothetical protein
MVEFQKKKKKEKEKEYITIYEKRLGLNNNWLLITP